MRDVEGVLMLQFEELKRDHEGCVRKIAKHVGKDLSDDVIKTIVHETTFDVMKKNPAFNNSKVNSNTISSIENQAKFRHFNHIFMNENVSVSKKC